MVGYSPQFLGDGHIVDLPEISHEHAENIAKSDDLRDERFVDYLNYTVVMNKDTRQAFYSAANADFDNNTGKGRKFRLDTRIEEHQLGNIYYKDLDGVENPYDRGHLTRRDAISWGSTSKLADRASRDSCFFTNVSLQHKNFNQDEWLALEKAIENANVDANNRFNIFVGPVFTEIGRIVTPVTGMEPGRVPSAFWKIISYLGKNTNAVEANAFIVFQDEEAITAKRQVLGDNQIDPFKLYQTTTTVIEQVAGLEFPQVLFDENPMLFHESAEAVALGVATPQMHQVTPLEADHGIIFSQ